MRGAVARQAEQAYERLDPAGRRAGPAGPAAAGRRGRGRRRRAAPRPAEPSSRATRSRRSSTCSPRRGWSRSARARSRSRTRRLLREWPRLRTWLEEDADGRRLHLHLMHAARGWQSAGRDPAELYRGARLASALDWTERHEPELDGLERAFVAASRAEAELRGRAPAACESSPAGPAGRTRSLAGARGGGGCRRRLPARPGARGQPWPPTRSASAPRRSTASASTRRCCWHAPAWSSRLRRDARQPALGADARPSRRSARCRATGWSSGRSP